MKKTAIVLVLSLLSVFGNAQKPTQNALLWKISGNKIKEPSYLFGTIHLMCPNEIKVDNAIKKAFAGTKQLYLEIDMNDPEMMIKTMKLMLMEHDESLENLVSKAAYDSMSSIFKSATGMPLSIMGKAKPMLLMSALFPSMLGCSPEGWEQQFQQMAKENNIPMKGLETIEYQMKVIDSIPYSTQATMLQETMYHLDSVKKSFTEMAGIYLKKDINALYELTVKDPDFGNYEATMLDNRNKNWIPIIANTVKQTPSFFAVGAAHLGGENGVIALLRKQGFVVMPVY